MINLFDTYNQASWDLHYSLVRSGYSHPTIALQDDGFLPDDVTSPYLYYTGFSVETKGLPLYFNQLEVPEFWEIRGDNSQGEIFDHDQKRGHIHYAEPKHQRLIKAVDWYDAKGRHRLTDRYNKYGHRYGQTVYSLEGQAILTSYFNRAGQEVIVDQHQTGDLLLTSGGQVHLFKHRADFVTHYLKEAGFALDRIFYNSLSVPFLVALYLGQEGQDVLFWQEPIGDEIPGNMQLLLKGQGRPTKILVQRRDAYTRLQALLAPEDRDKVELLGFLYPFKTGERDRKQALILTNSDQIEQLDTILDAQPDLHFHIGALTEMSAKLTRLSSHPQVSLYPNITVKRAQELLRTCGLYLDINHHGEILNGVRAAFEHGLVILAFEETAHNRAYTADGLLFASGEIAELNACLTRIVQEPSQAQAYVAEQEQQAGLESAATYQRLIG